MTAPHAFATVTLLVAFLSGCGPGAVAPPEPDASTDPPPKHLAGGGRPSKVGERTEAGGIALTIESVTRQGGLGKFVVAKEGNEFVVITVVIETTGRDYAPYHWAFFTAKDNQGVQYKATRNPFEGGLRNYELPKGDKIRGEVAFEVKEGTGGLVVTYEPTIAGEGYQAVRVVLDK
jgi:hypothetical protein